MCAKETPALKCARDYHQLWWIAYIFVIETIKRFPRRSKDRTINFDSHQQTCESRLVNWKQSFVILSLSFSSYCSFITSAAKRCLISLVNNCLVYFYRHMMTTVHARRWSHFNNKVIKFLMRFFGIFLEKSAEFWPFNKKSEWFSKNISSFLSRNSSKTLLHFKTIYH